MIKTISTALILSTCFITGCASNSQGQNFAGDNCKTLGTLYAQQNVFPSAKSDQFNNIDATQTSPDKITLPWSRSNEEEISRDRASIRKSHARKTCAQ